jgi:hypothetical protein
LDESNLKKLNDLISQINWSNTTLQERNLFSNSMLTLELASQAKKITNSVSRARLITLIVCLATTCCLMWSEVQPGIIIGVILAIQMLFFAFSQLLEHGAGVLMQKSEKATFKIADGLLKKHPRGEDNSDNDIFIF